MTAQELNSLKVIAAKSRIETLKMLQSADADHIASPFAVTELVAYIYFAYLDYDSKATSSPYKDYFIASNSRITPTFYSILAIAGFFDVSALKTYAQSNSILPRSARRGITPGVFATAGAPGQGLSQAVGVASGLKADKKNKNVVCLISDIEHQQGQVWEALMAASNFKLDNLTVVVDRSKVSLSGYPLKEGLLNSAATKHDQLALRYTSFGFDVYEIDGHDFEQIDKAFRIKHFLGRPKAIIAHTQGAKNIDGLNPSGIAGSKEKLESLVTRNVDKLTKEMMGYEI